MENPKNNFKDKQELMIDSEFEKLIPPLTEEEFQQLTENILEENRIVDPIRTWNGVIVDGHNRYRIAMQHPHITYTVHKMQFPNRFAAKAFIFKNQLGRRNLTPYQKKYLVGKQYNVEKHMESFRGNQHTAEKSGCGQIDHNHQNKRTCERIATENGVGEKYVRRAEHFALGLDLAEEVDPGIRQGVLSGELVPTEPTVHAMLNASPAEQKELCKKIRATTKRISTKAPKVNEINHSNAISIHNPATANVWDSVLIEMTDALESLIFRWEFCQTHNAVFFDDPDCQKEIRSLIRKGSDFINNYEGGLS